MDTSYEDIDERYHTSNLYTSIEGSILCSSLSSLSIIASIATITIILRSYDGLSSIYHRFFFCNSLANILFSSATALNTLMMPTDMPYTAFEGLHIGNQTTCTIQGLLFLSGITADFCYFTGLVLYYLCSITFKMLDSTFRKYIEPLIHVVTCFVCVYASTVALLGEMINPSVHKNWCAREKLPFWCNDNDDINKDDENNVVCIRGNNATEESMMKSFFIFSIVLVILVCISMILIIISVYRLDKLSTVAANQQNSQVGTSTSNDNINSTKVILVQISAYLLSITLFITCSHLLVPDRRDASLSTQYFLLIIVTTHGLFNFCIFVGHKVYNLRRVEQSLSLNSAIWKVIMIRNENVFIFENIIDTLESNRSMSFIKSPSEHDENQSHPQVHDPDPIRPAHIITMFHLNSSENEKDDWSLPTKEHDRISINDDDLPSKNDLSSSIRVGDSEKHSLDLSVSFGSNSE
jgi:hypothetical protein